MTRINILAHSGKNNPREHRNMTKLFSEGKSDRKSIISQYNYHNLSLLSQFVGKIGVVNPSSRGEECILNLHQTLWQNEIWLIISLFVTMFSTQNNVQSHLC